MEIDVEEFKKRFPALYRELSGGKSSVGVGGVRTSSAEAEKEASARTPTVIDYLRRCDTDEQGREVVEYLLSRGELSKDYAEILLSQLKEKGIRSFGSRKELGHYFRKGF